MGLHTGEAELDPAGTNMPSRIPRTGSARIHSAAHGGQILLSAETYELCNHQLPADSQPERLWASIVSKACCVRSISTRWL